MKLYVRGIREDEGFPRLFVDRMVADSPPSVFKDKDNLIERVEVGANSGINWGYKGRGTVAGAAAIIVEFIGPARPGSRKYKRILKSSMQMTEQRLAIVPLSSFVMSEKMVLEFLHPFDRFIYKLKQWWRK